MGRGWVRAWVRVLVIRGGSTDGWVCVVKWVLVSVDGWVRGVLVDSWVDGSMKGYTLCYTGCVVSSWAFCLLSTTVARIVSTTDGYYFLYGNINA